MLFVYSSLRGSLSVGVMFTLLLPAVIMVKNVKSMPLLKPSESQTDGKSGSLGLQQHLVKISGWDQIVLRISVVFFGVVLAFAMLICLCATFWCASWIIQWPTTNFSWNRIISRRFRGSRKQMAIYSNDLPPAYEVILAYQEDERVTGMITEEEEPPSYSDALLHSGAL